MRGLRDDSGAVTVLVALLMPVVLLGLGAIVIDAGALYAERRQLQNGADAAALALAKEYASTASATCVPGAGVGTADPYADQNSNDIFGSVTEAIECPAPNEVRVTTATRSGEGGSMRPFLAQFLGAGDTTVRAVAAAAWGPPSGLTSALPLTISECEYNAATSGGLAVGPPFDAALEEVLHFHNDKTHESGCPTSASGSDAPGGFGWILSSTCQATTSSATPVYDADPGLSIPSGCTSSYLASLIGTVVSIPVFSSTNGLTGSNLDYNMNGGYVGFYLTGYRLSGNPAFVRNSPSLHPSRRCTGEQRCIYGYFTTDPTPGSGVIGTGPFMGVNVVQMTE